MAFSALTLWEVFFSQTVELSPILLALNILRLFDETA